MSIMIHQKYSSLILFVIIVVFVSSTNSSNNNNFCKNVISSQRLQSLKRDLIEQCHLFHSSSSIGTTTTSSSTDEDSQESMLRRIEQLESLSPCAFDSMDQFTLLDGKWKTIFTTLPLKRLQTLKALTYNNIPIDVPITVTSMYQTVDYAAKTYDNHVDFSLDSLPEVGGFISTVGSILQPEDAAVSSVLRKGALDRPQRLLIDFAEMFLISRVDLSSPTAPATAR